LISPGFSGLPDVSTIILSHYKKNQSGVDWWSRENVLRWIYESRVRGAHDPTAGHAHWTS
jgi:hypothetical protein